jgi:hypothetical protein
MHALSIEHARRSALSPRDRGDLVFYWHELDSAVGFRSAHRAMVDRMAGISAPSARSIESIVDSGAIARGRSVRQALVRMQEAGLGNLVTVLHHFYGPRRRHKLSLGPSQVAQLFTLRRAAESAYVAHRGGT